MVCDMLLFSSWFQLHDVKLTFLKLLRTVWITKEFGCGMLITLAKRVWLIRKTKNNMLVFNNKFREMEFTKAVAEKKEKSRASERDE